MSRATVGDEIVLLSGGFVAALSRDPDNPSPVPSLDSPRLVLKFNKGKMTPATCVSLSATALSFPTR